MLIFLLKKYYYFSQLFSARKQPEIDSSFSYLYPMKILFFGAGVIGSVYAARFMEAGFEVSVMARGKRADDARKNGISIKNLTSAKTVQSKIRVIEKVSEHERFDLLIVTVRFEQLPLAIPALQAIPAKSILFMLNFPGKIGEIAQSFPDKKTLAGFPGIGGYFDGETVAYIEIKEQKTTIGFLSEGDRKLASTIRKLFSTAGFKTALTNDIQSWLISHAVFISCFSAAIIKENGSSIKLGKNREAVKTLITAVREGFKALENQNIAIEPFGIKMIFMIMPLWFSVWYWQKVLQSDTGVLGMEPHLKTSGNELSAIAKKVQSLVDASKVPTPAFDELIDVLIK